MLVADCRGHTRSVNSVAFSAVGVIASASADGTVRVWDALSGQCVNVLFFEFPVVTVDFTDIGVPMLVVADDHGSYWGYEISV